MGILFKLVTSAYFLAKIANLCKKEKIIRRQGIMKKVVALLLSATMVLSLSACAGGGEETTAAATDGTTTAAAAEDTTAAAGDTTAAASGEDLGLTTEDITLTMNWWGGDSRHEATQNAVNAFMEKYPNIKVETSFGGWSGWEDNMGMQFATDTAPDVVQINWNWIYNFGASGDVFYDLNQVSDVLDLTQFPESALEASTLDGKLQGVPIAMTARTMFWTKATFDKAGIEIPTTWDELLAAGETFKTVLGDEYYPMMMTEYDRAIFLVYYLESMYNKPWVVDGQLNYTVEEIAEGFAMLKELEDKHVMPTIQMIKDYAAEPVEQSDRWIDGYWAGVYTWNTSPAPLIQGLSDELRDSFTVGTMFEGLPAKGGFNKISMEFAITQTCEHPREAAALINFLLNEEEGVLLMTGERGVPASAVGAQIAEENGIIDQIIIDATNAALNSGWNGFALDPYFEDSNLKANPDGVYYKVYSAHSYGEMDDAAAAQALYDGVTEVLNNNQ